MAIPGVNSIKRFRIEFDYGDPHRRSEADYIAARRQHVAADREEANRVWLALSPRQREQGDFDDLFEQIRVENDGVRIIKNQIAYVDDWFAFE